MIHGRNVLDHPEKNDERTNNNIQKITNGHGDDYPTDCFLGYSYFKEPYRMIAVDLKSQRQGFGKLSSNNFRKI